MDSRLPKYKLVILDFDGTLADSFPWFMQNFNSVADRYGFRRVEAGEIEMLRGLEPKQIIEHFKVPVWKMPFVARHIRKLMTGQIGEIPLFPGAGEMIQQLAEKGLMLAVVTSNTEANVRSVLGPENAGLIKYYLGDAGIFGKTSKIKKLLRLTNIPAAETICIGDEVRDIEAARAAGTACGAVSWGYASPEALASRAPNEMFLTMNEIVKNLTGADREFKG